MTVFSSGETEHICDLGLILFEGAKGVASRVGNSLSSTLFPHRDVSLAMNAAHRACTSVCVVAS